MSNYLVVVLNGPPGCGKDTLAEYIAFNGHPFYMFGEHRTLVYHEKFAEPIKDALSAFLDISRDELEFNKNIPGLLPNNQSIRRSLITMSEEWAKPTFGNGIFGTMLGKKIERYVTRSKGKFIRQDPKQLYIISDSGFYEELEALEELHPGKVRLIRIGRDGCTYEGDSRSYLFNVPLRVKAVDIGNNSTKEAFYKEATKVITEWCNEQFSGTVSRVPAQS